MPAFPEDFIERVRAANDIVEVISQQVRLERKGQNHWGLCPFHSEKTPSFSVNASKQMYYCFGCHAHGTVFNFVMETDKLSFPEAVKLLAQRVGLSIPEEETVSPKVRAQQKEKQLLYRVNQWVADLYHEQLLKSAEAKEARDYLERRGIQEKLILSMQLGFSFPDWSGLIRAAERSKVPLDALVKLGLVLPRKQQGYYDRFRGRVMIPIADERGRIVAFGGRVLDDTQPKYLNSPEHALFSKGKLLFGLSQASKAIDQAGYAVLVEGYMDCLSAWQHGVYNVVASLGTALTSQQARLLKRYSNQAVLCYDGDSAGLQAAIRGVEVLSQSEVDVKVATLPSGQDPDDFLRQHGQEYFISEILQKAKPIIDFQLDMLRRQYPLQDPAGRAQYVRQATALLTKIDNAVLQATYAQRLATELHVPESAVHAELSKQKGRKIGKTRDKYGNDRHTIEDTAHTVIMDDDPVHRGCQVAENKLLGLLLRNMVGAEELLLEWKALGTYAYPIDEQIVNLLLAELEKGQVLDAHRLLEQVLDKEISQRITEVALTDCPEEQNAAVVARDCLAKLRQLSIRQAIKDVEVRLSSEQNKDTRKQLLQELQALLEKQKGLRH